MVRDELVMLHQLLDAKGIYEKLKFEEDSKRPAEDFEDAMKRIANMTTPTEEDKKFILTTSQQMVPDFITSHVKQFSKDFKDNAMMEALFNGTRRSNKQYYEQQFEKSALPSIVHTITEEQMQKNKASLPPGSPLALPASANWANKSNQLLRSASERAKGLGASVSSGLESVHDDLEQVTQKAQVAANNAQKGMIDSVKPGLQRLKSTVGDIRPPTIPFNLPEEQWKSAKEKIAFGKKMLRTQSLQVVNDARRGVSILGDASNGMASTGANQLRRAVTAVRETGTGLYNDAQQALNNNKPVEAEQAIQKADKLVDELNTAHEEVRNAVNTVAPGAIPSSDATPEPAPPAPAPAPASDAPAEASAPAPSGETPAPASDAPAETPGASPAPGSSAPASGAPEASVEAPATGIVSPQTVTPPMDDTCPRLSPDEQNTINTEVDRLIANKILSEQSGKLLLLVSGEDFENALSPEVKDIFTGQSGGKKKDRKQRGGVGLPDVFKRCVSGIRSSKKEQSQEFSQATTPAAIYDGISTDIKTFVGDTINSPIAIASGIPETYQPKFLAVALLDRKFKTTTNTKTKKEALALMANTLQNIANMVKEGTAGVPGGAKKHRKHRQRGGDEGVDSSKMYNTQGLISELSSTFDKAIITNTTMIPKPFSASGYAGYTSSVDVSLPSEYKADYIPDMTNVVSGGGKKRSHRKEGGWPTLNRPMTAPVKGMPHSSLLQRAHQAMSPVGQRVASAVVRVRNAASPLGQNIHNLVRGSVEALGSSLPGGEAGEAEQEGAGRFGDVMRSIGHGIGTGARGFARGVRASAHGVARGVRASAHRIAQGARRVGHAIRSRSPSPMGARPGFLARLRSRSPSPMGARPGFLSRFRSRSPSPMGAPMGAPGPVRAPLARSPAVSRSPSPVGMGRGLPAQRPAPLSRSASVRSATAPATAPALAGPATPMSLAERAMRFAENNPKTALAIAGLAAQIANGSPQTQNPYGAPVDCNHSFYANYPTCVEQRKRMMRSVPPTLIGGKTKNPKTSKALKKK